MNFTAFSGHRLAIVPLLALTAACSAETERTTSDQGTDSTDQNVFSLGNEWEDRNGLTWEQVGRVEYSNKTVEEVLATAPRNVNPEEQREDYVLTLSLEEAAQYLRPRLEIGGYEYILSEKDSISYAQRVRDVVSGKVVLPDSPSSLAGSLGPMEPAGTEEERKIIYDDWYRINSSAHQLPYSWSAAMDQGAGLCTAFKIQNQHTAATAAHCVKDPSTGAWLSRQRLQFGAGSDSTSGTGQAEDHLPTGCYGRVTPGCFSAVGTCDYAVFYLSGNGAWCDVNDYDVGWFGSWYVGSTETNMNTRTQSYPGSPPSGAYPSLFYQNRSDGWASGSGNSFHVRYRVDTLGGSSGSPIWGWVSNDYRLRAVHNDRCDWLFCGQLNCSSPSCDWNYGMAFSSTMDTFFQTYAGF